MAALRRAGGLPLLCVRSPRLDARAKTGASISAHDELVEKAGWWLAERRRMCPVLLEPGYGGGRERPDAIGWSAYHRLSIVVECKAARPDFLGDKAKDHRLDGSGMGVQRYYMAPRGVVFPDDLASDSWPGGWGYLELRGRPEKGIAGARVYVVKEAARRELHPHDKDAEFRVLMGALANVQFRDRYFDIGAGTHQAHNLGRNPHREYWRGRDEGFEAGVSVGRRHEGTADELAVRQGGLYRGRAY